MACRSLKEEDTYLIALEGGGTRSQAALMDFQGCVLHIHESTDVNTNFVAFEEAKKAVLQAVSGALQAAQILGDQVSEFVAALVGPKFGPEVYAPLLPKARYHYYGEREVVFARAGIYRPHGVALVAATGATAWGVRADDGRHTALGGWGSLLGMRAAPTQPVARLRAAVRCTNSAS
jgi:N-acetylglucosamine kinase-like BadF-type ATPase